MSDTSRVDERPLRFDLVRFSRNLLLACVVTEIGWVLADAFINYRRLTDLGMIRRLFNIAREDSLASWFGVTQTVMVALTVWVIYIVIRGLAATTRRRRIAWLLLALFFSYMAMDDGAEIHERVGSAFKKVVDQNQGERVDSRGEEVKGLSFYPSYPWHLFFVPLFAVAALLLLLFLWREVRDPVSRGMIALALALFALAIGLDFIEGLTSEHPLNLHTRIQDALELRRYTVRHFAKSLEEFFEMFGTTLLWAAFLRHLVQVRPTLSLELR